MNRLAEDGCSVTYLGRYGHGSSEPLLDGNIIKKHLSEYPPSQGGLFKRVAGLIQVAFQRWYSYLKLYFSKEKYDLALVGLQGLDPWCVCRLVKARGYGVFIRTDIARSPTRERIKKTFRRYAKAWTASSALPRR
jgi:hypothetical protein